MLTAGPPRAAGAAGCAFCVPVRGHPQSRSRGRARPRFPGRAGGGARAPRGGRGSPPQAPPPRPRGAWPGGARANQRAVTCGGGAVLAPPASCGSRGRCPALPWQRRRRLRSRSRSRSCSCSPSCSCSCSCSVPDPHPGAPGTAPGQQRGETRPSPGAASRPLGAHPQRGPRSGAAGAIPSGVFGGWGAGLVLPSWERLLPAGLREEGGSSCPECWGQLVFSSLSRDCPARGGVRGTRLVLPSPGHPLALEGRG